MKNKRSGINGEAINTLNTSHSRSITCCQASLISGTALVESQGCYTEEQKNSLLFPYNHAYQAERDERQLIARIIQEKF